MSRMFTVTPQQTSEEILHCMKVGLTPLVTSSPGMGKSSIVQQIAKDYRLKLLDLRLSQCTPEDLQGFPMRNGNKATFTPFDTFPIEEDEIPEGYQGWLLFLDELTSASKPVQAAAYKLILDRQVGSYALHENVAIVAAGNKISDKAVVNQMSTALQSRLVHYEMTISSQEWLEYAYKQDLDHRIISFISYMPSKLMDFRPDHQDVTFPCPRTWEFLSKLIEGESICEKRGARIAGTIGEGAAVEFITFAREFDRIPKIDQIIKEPKTLAIPDEASTKYATMSMLIEHANKKNLAQIIPYIERFDIEIQIVFARGMAVKYPTLASDHDEFGKYVREMARFLF